MAVVKMSKFTAIGLDIAEDTLITKLMELGATELNNQDHKLTDEKWAPLVSKGGREDEVAALEGKLASVDTALKTISVYDTAKKPLFSLRQAVTDQDFASVADKRVAIEADVLKVLELSSHIKELKNRKNKTEALANSLMPWIGYQIPLELQSTRYTCVLIGVIPLVYDIEQLRSTLGELTDQFELTLITKDSAHQYISLIYLKELDDKIIDVLKQFDFGIVSFGDMAGTAEESIARLKSEHAAIAENITEAEKSLADMAARKDGFKLLYDYLSVERDRIKAFNNMLTTHRTFYIDGWVPAMQSDNLTALFEDFGCHCEVTTSAIGEETPVLLKNNKLIAPIETITTLYDTPSSREIDPTPVFAFFYVCFFGIMFADIGYGLLLAGLSYLAVRSGKMEGSASKFIKQLGYCGIAAALWGVVFGSFFGNIITVVSETFWGNTLSLKPLWINPVDDPMTMLVFSCICGVIHIFVALGVKAYSHIRAGRLSRAVSDSFLWYLLILGLGLLLAGNNLFPSAANVGKWMSIIGASGILLLPVLTGKGLGRLSGLKNIVSITSYLSDILSYVRLLALCLAGGVVAQVFNILASMFGGGVLGAIMFVLISILAHTLNFLLGALGAFVHSIRLQYVEFFGKFFEGKGTPFAPFMRNTKYVKIVKEGS